MMWIFFPCNFQDLLHADKPITMEERQKNKIGLLYNQSTCLSRDNVPVTQDC